MKRIKILICLLLVSIVINSQNKDKVLLSIDGEDFTVSQFKRVHEKNLQIIESEESKDVNKSLGLFINYKLKVKQAYDLNLDTLKSYKREIQTYQNQLTSPYLQDKSFLDSLIREAYNRTKKEVRVSHILVTIPSNPKPKDTIEAYNKIIGARKRILEGEDFEVVAKEVSTDPSVKFNGGDLGFFSAFRMVYDFENTAYNTKKGEVSQPFKTRFGYHILIKTDERISKGEIEVAHIMITGDEKVGKLKIDSIYNKILDGKDFTKLAKKYSNDTSSKKIGGKLPKFGTGRMVPSFEKEAFLLENEGDFSKPFQTNYGWHIIKLLKKYPVGSFDEIQEQITEKVNRSGRVKLSDKIVLDRLKNKYIIEEIETSKEILKRKDIREITKDSLQNTLLIINNKRISQQDFVDYIFNRRDLSIDILFTQFKDVEILNYFRDNLVNTEPEFAATLQEYQEGLLLFELMEEKIWDVSQDSIALKTYFDNHQNKYQQKDLDEIRGKVMDDFQNELEENWIADLRSKSEIKIKNSTLKKIIKFYRKED